MNDRIIELAKQAGFFIDVLSEPMRIGVFHQKIDKELKRFAELVRNEALEEAANTIDKLSDASVLHTQQFALDVACDKVRSMKK